MAEDHPVRTNSQTDDNSQTAHGGSNVRINLVGFDNPLLTALAVALGVMAIIFTLIRDANDRERLEKIDHDQVAQFEKVDHDERQLIYFTQRSEAFIEQLAFQGYKVPPGLLNPPAVVKGDPDERHDNRGRHPPR